MCKKLAATLAVDVTSEFGYLWFSWKITDQAENHSCYSAKITYNQYEVGSGVLGSVTEYTDLQRLE